MKYLKLKVGLYSIWPTVSLFNLSLFTSPLFLPLLYYYYCNIQ